jgi:hypothetical protein
MEVRIRSARAIRSFMGLGSRRRQEDALTLDVSYDALNGPVLPCRQLYISPYNKRVTESNDF